MPTPLKYQISSTVSPQATAELTKFYNSGSGLIQGNPPESLADFDALTAKADEAKKPLSDAVANQYEMTIEKQVLGGVNVLRIRPHNYDANDRRLLVYIHGGGFVVFSAEVELVLPSLIGTNVGAEIVSIDYTLSPRGTYETITKQVLDVYKAILEDGQDPNLLGLFGDSVGGNITLASVLRMRDEDIPLPAALVLLSPSSDISEAGDSRLTMDERDPVLSKSSFAMMSKVYAPDGNEKSPYASPVHGDFTNSFPPVLIQGGTRELLLSDFVRVYQALIQGEKEAVLDLYEGMCHVFQARLPDVPETQAAVRRAGEFFRTKLQPGA